jgi:hypothetical protein
MRLIGERMHVRSGSRIPIAGGKSPDLAFVSDNIVRHAGQSQWTGDCRLLAAGFQRLRHYQVGACRDYRAENKTDRQNSTDNHLASHPMVAVIVQLG